jgi:hypothetical protein
VSVTIEEEAALARPEVTVIDSVLNLLFRCSHRRLTRPVTPVGKAGKPHGDTYVVCLDCGKQFAYDVKEMRIGKPLETTNNGGVLRPDMPKPRSEKVKYAVWASLPLMFVAGALWKSNKRKPEDEKSGRRTPPTSSR